MVNVLTSLRALTPPPPPTPLAAVRKPLTRLTEKGTAPQAAPAAVSTPGTAASTAPAATPSQPQADFRALFSGQVFPAVPDPPAQKPNPTAESVFGPSPWLANPTGTGPNGGQYSYNPFYFATRQTAEKVAAMSGGTVIESNMHTGSGGGIFAQNQPNYMVRLADGRIINPGLVASFYTHGYSQSYVDQMVAAELKNA